MAETLLGHAPLCLLHSNSAFDMRIRMEETRGAYVYMLINGRGNVLYTGCTENLKERLYLHKNRMIAGFTKKNNVDRLVYFERHADMGSARKRERELKGKSRVKKEALIKSFNPTFSELDPETI